MFRENVAVRGQVGGRRWSGIGRIGVSGELAGEIGNTVNDSKTALEREISCVD